MFAIGSDSEKGESTRVVVKTRTNFYDDGLIIISLTRAVGIDGIATSECVRRRHANNKQGPPTGGGVVEYNKSMAHLAKMALPLRDLFFCSSVGAGLTGGKGRGSAPCNMC
jgi:hypothetical protein